MEALESDHDGDSGDELVPIARKRTHHQTRSRPGSGSGSDTDDFQFAARRRKQRRLPAFVETETLTQQLFKPYKPRNSDGPVSRHYGVHPDAGAHPAVTTDQLEGLLSQLSRVRVSRDSDTYRNRMRELHGYDDDSEQGLVELDRMEVEKFEAQRAYRAAAGHTTLVPPTATSSWATQYNALAEKLEREEERESTRFDIESRLDYHTDPLYGCDQIDGDTRLQAFNETLDSFRWARTSAQVMFHEMFTSACLPKMYGPGWDANAERVMKEYGVKKIKTEAMIMTPRRYGKTVSVAMWVAAALLHLPGTSIGIFSTGQRASNALMQMTAGFLKEIDGAERRICKLNQKELFVSQDPLPDGAGLKGSEAQRRILLPTTSKLHSFPSSVESRCTLHLCCTVSVMVYTVLLLLLLLSTRHYSITGCKSPGHWHHRLCHLRPQTILETSLCVSRLLSCSRGRYPSLNLEAFP